MKTTTNNPKLVSLLAAGLLAGGCLGAPPNVGESQEGIASVMGSYEWAVDAPWRMEPPYDKLPITFTIHDVDNQFQTPTTFGHLCGMFVAEEDENGANKAIQYYTPNRFHEVERSARWPADSDYPSFHTLKRLWAGEHVTDADLTLDGSGEFHATLLHDSIYAHAGQDRVFTAVAVVSQTCPTEFDPLAPQMNVHYPTPDEYLGHVGNTYVPYYRSWFFANTLRVHYAAQPLPKFGTGWVYGDIHYHSQGTDNEGESGMSYRAVIQTMKAMGLDFIIASDHASGGIQLTDIEKIFVDKLPDDLPYLPDWDWIKQMILDKIAGYSVPLDRTYNAARDMNLRRWKYFRSWINDPNGVNQQVLSGGGTRMPQIFLGGEVDAIPEISEAERVSGYLEYGDGLRYDWTKICTDVPSEFLTLQNLTTFQVCPTRDSLLTLAAEGGRWKVHDVQGLATITYYARQHFISMPLDPAREDGFVASNTTQYGGAFNRLKTFFEEDYGPQQNKGYVFLAHPVSAASGKTSGRMGPDILPYSDVQLQTAFQSPAFLGLQLWNEDNHLSSAPGTAFPIAGGSVRWQTVNESGQLFSLHHGAAAWDKLNLWGINPSKTSQIGWLDGGPRRSFMAGGSDAHGDMNFRREGAITGWDNAVDTALGKPRNLVFVGDNRTQTVGSAQTLGQTQTIQAFATGNFAVTDGPVVRIAIDTNNNGVIDDGDVLMGGVQTLPINNTSTTVPLIVEWKSTPEFGPVGSIDLYVGSQAGTAEGIVYAPDGHGPMKATATTTLNGPNGTTFKKISDRYWADRTGKLRITPLAKFEGYSGSRKIILDRNDYPLVTTGCHTETQIIQATCDPVTHHCTKPSTISYQVCDVSATTPPVRNFIRAFVRSSVQAPAGALGSSQWISRFGYSNPVWVVPYHRYLPGVITVGNVLTLSP